MTEADALLSQLEAKRGILPNTLEIVAALETAQGHHQAYAIGTASARTWGLTLGRADLIMDLRPEPSGEIHLMTYLMQRLITVAGATGTTPIGAWWRAPDRGLLATPDHTYQAARRGRAIGFKGAMCLLDNQVEALNRGFTPAAVEIAAAEQLLATYAGSVAQGAAAIKQGDKIIDAGMAVQARRLLALASACAARDQAKAASGRSIPASLVGVSSPAQ
jgi:citrate lyase subunit beta/citryl-CoA lyase